MDEIKIKITQDLIDMADQGDPGNCAIAMAIRLASDNINYVRVEHGRIRFSVPSEGLRYTFSSSRADKFTENFDVSKRLARPFTLTLKGDDASEIRPIRRTPALNRRGNVPRKLYGPRRLRPLVLTDLS